MKRSATVRSFMAHHQGMSLLALVSLLRELPMQRRFMARPLLKAADLLLQERVPKTEASVLPEDLELEETRPRFGEGEDVMRVFKSPMSRDAGSSSPFQRPLSCRHQQCRRRLQSLARSGRHPLARGCDAAIAGARFSICAM